VISRPRAAAGLLAVAAVVLPPTSAAQWLAGDAGPLVITGVWILKATLLLHAGWLMLVERVPLAGTGVLLPGATEESDRRPAPYVVGLLMAGAVLRLVHLSAGLWFDEIQTLVDYVRLPLGRIVTTFDSQNQHLLYSVLARIATAGLGEGAVALRLPAALLGIASLAATWWVARMVTGRVEAFLATALLTVSYHHVWFSQNARGYTSLLLWTLVATGLLLQLLRDDTKGWGATAGYGLAAALAMYSHSTAVFVVAAHAVVVTGLAWHDRARSPRGWWRPAAGLALATSFTLLLYSLVLPQFLDTLVRPGPAAAATEWQNPLWLVRETLAGLARGLPGGWLTLVAGGGLVIAGIVSYWRQQPAVASLLVLPGALTGCGIFVLSHNLWPRFFFFSASFGVLIVFRGLVVAARAMAPARHPVPAAAIGALLVVGSALTVPRAWGPKQDFNGAAAYVESHRAQSDGVATVDLTVMPYSRYLREPWQPVDSLPALLDLERSHGRTWLLYTFPIRLRAVQPGVWQRLASHYDTAAVFPGTIGDGAIVLMLSRADSALRDHAP
jgi:mannosyltransferase